MSFDSAAAIQRAQDDCIRLLILVSTVIANPTQTNIDAVINGAAGANTLVPRPNYSAQGVSFSWAEYYVTLQESITRLQKLQTVVAGSFEVRSRGV